MQSIKRMTVAEYKSLMNGYLLRQQDELEYAAIQAFYTSRAGGFDKNGKPLVSKITDLFDKEKAIRHILGSKISDEDRAEKIKNFVESKAHAEALLNGLTIQKGDN